MHKAHASVEVNGHAKESLKLVKITSANDSKFVDNSVFGYQILTIF